MSEIKVAMVMGSNAPNRQAELTLEQSYPGEWLAYWEQGYDVCGDYDCGCHKNIIMGTGNSAFEAIEDYWEQWAIRYEN